ncbi:NAD-dependent epimerase/dehydratase family protein [archaeon AH-315-M20]|nr:NAD-dependent epimerase/dehydratase family protein [archaeon AH-315-M20]
METDNNGKILVTGCSGFVGNHLVQELIKRKYPIIGISRSTKPVITLNKKYFKHYTCDLADIKGLKEIFQKEKISSVLHIAAKVPKNFNETQPGSFDVNPQTTSNLLKLSKEFKVKKFIYSSSMSVYGTPKHIPIDENHPKEPIEDYGKSKLEGEKLCETYKEDMDIIILRYAGVFGEGKEDGAIYNFIKNAKENKPITVTGDGSQTHDFVDVKDIVQANILALELPDEKNPRIFNIGSGNEISIKFLVKKIKESLNSSSEVIYKKENIQKKRFLLDITKAKSILNYSPTPIGTSLKRLIGN